MALATEVPHFPDENEEKLVVPPHSAGLPLSVGTAEGVYLKASSSSREQSSTSNPPLLEYAFEGIHGAVEACVPYAQSVSRNIGQLRDKARQLKEEKPLQFLTGVAGCAFALGLAIRLWRSKS
jgi:hypothetical protein